MRNGKVNGTIKKVKLVAVYDALRKTNCVWADAAKLLGMSARGVATFAQREGLVRCGRKLGEKRWVLA